MSLTPEQHELVEELMWVAEGALHHKGDYMRWKDRDDDVIERVRRELLGDPQAAEKRYKNPDDVRSRPSATARPASPEPPTGEQP